MSNRFAPPTVGELAARGLDADGNPIKKAAPEPAAPKPAAKKVAAEASTKTAAKKGVKG
jgi:hypothetical protein